MQHPEGNHPATLGQTLQAVDNKDQSSQSANRTVDDSHRHLQEFTPPETLPWIEPHAASQ
jgi:hypothetical protein